MIGESTIHKILDCYKMPNQSKITIKFSYAIAIQSGVGWGGRCLGLLIRGLKFEF